MKNVAQENEKAIRGAIKVDEKEVLDHLDGLVRRSVDDTLNQLLNAEADAICQASRYQRSADRQDTRAGSYKRKLLTKAGEVELNIPRLRSLPFETQIIKRYQTRQSSVEEALIEMYLAGVLVRRVEDITEALWGAEVSSSTVSELNQKIYGKIEEWRQQPIEGEYLYIFLDGIYLKRSLGGEVQNVSVLVAVGINDEGYREMLGFAVGYDACLAEAWQAGDYYDASRWLPAAAAPMKRSRPIPRPVPLLVNGAPVAGKSVKNFAFSANYPKPMCRGAKLWRRMNTALPKLPATAWRGFTTSA